MERKYKKTTDLKKRKLARLYRNGASVHNLAKEYNLSESSIRHWIERYSGKNRQIKLISAKEYNDLKRHAEKITREINIQKRFMEGLGISNQTKYSFMDQIYGEYSLHELCEAMDMDRGTYYNHLRNIDKQAADEAEKAYHMDMIAQSFYDSHRTYGAGRIRIDLAKKGLLLSEGYIRDLMHELGIGKTHRTAKDKLYDTWANRKANNLLDQYTVDGINQLWVTDMLEFNYRGKKLFICAYLDAYSRNILYLKQGPRKSTNHTARGLRESIATRHPNTGLVLHCDHGGENCSFTMNRLCVKYGIVRSFSRKSSPTDNPVIESFFKTLRSELLYIGDNFHSEATLAKKLDEYKDYYNNHRIHTSLKGYAPAEYEQKYPHSTKRVYLQKQDDNENPMF